MNQSPLIGRQTEQEQLNHYIRSPKAEFIAVYGRPGIKGASLSTQLSIFAEKYSTTFLNKITV